MLDPVLKVLALLVAHQLVAVAGGGFTQDRALGLVGQHPTKYPSVVHSTSRELWAASFMYAFILS